MNDHEASISHQSLLKPNRFAVKLNIADPAARFNWKAQKIRDLANFPPSKTNIAMELLIALNEVVAPLTSLELDSRAFSSHINRLDKPQLHWQLSLQRCVEWY